jgi:hypothetical protein
MARLHVVTDSRWRRSVRIAGKGEFLARRACGALLIARTGRKPKKDPSKCSPPMLDFTEARKRAR